MSPFHCGKIVDPFGHEWGINQQLQEQTEDQTRAAAEEFFGKERPAKEAK